MKHAREEIGINSVPTFIIGERILSGLLSKENLEREIIAASLPELGTSRKKLKVLSLQPEVPSSKLGVPSKKLDLPSSKLEAPRF